jgi:N6-L-threonylcarbamoyladenine synthase
MAIVEDGRTILSNVVSSQVEMHAKFGGIVPEVASRQHILSLVPTFKETLAKGKMSKKNIDAIAVTHGPGLAGALISGVNFAKGLAISLGIPMIGINHLEGHIYAGWIGGGNPEVTPGFPIVCLIASGGHTDLILMEGHGKYRLIGRTRDDAAGEAFDKAARMLGLGFPGGPAIQKVSEGSKSKEDFPRPLLNEAFDFSFSGLKTAFLRRAQEKGLTLDTNKRDSIKVADMASGFQEAVVDVLVTKTLKAASKHMARGILIGGGVAANARLRQKIRELSSLPVIIPSPSLCTDNGAMIAACGYFRSINDNAELDIDIIPTFPLGLDRPLTKPRQRQGESKD